MCGSLRTVAQQRESGSPVRKAHMSIRPHVCYPKNDVPVQGSKDTRVVRADPKRD
jgi:hypothetical protein